MARNNYILLISIALSLSACYNAEREQRLLNRERSLLVREKQFARKEAEYQALLRMRDSLMTAKDTSTLYLTWPEHIAGQWSSRVICTESNCTDYIIGDLRSDTWIFSSDSTQMTVKVLSNNALVRVYTASYRGDVIHLDFRTDSTASRQVTMNILLNEIGTDKMRGTRILSVDNRCTAKFNVELTRTATVAATTD